MSSTCVAGRRKAEGLGHALPVPSIAILAGAARWRALRGPPAGSARIPAATSTSGRQRCSVSLARATLPHGAFGCIRIFPWPA